MGECMRISIIASNAIDHNIETLHIWMDSMKVHSWIMNLALCTERIVVHCIDNILENQKMFNAVKYHYVNTKENPTEIASHGISQTYDHDKIDLWLHGPELLSNPELWQNPVTLPQNIMVLKDNDNIEKPEQKSVEHIIDKRVIKYSDHAKTCKTVAIFLAFRRYWIAMLCTKHWQTNKD